WPAGAGTARKSSHPHRQRLPELERRQEPHLRRHVQSRSLERHGRLPRGAVRRFRTPVDLSLPPDERSTAQRRHARALPPRSRREAKKVGEKILQKLSPRLRSPHAAIEIYRSRRIRASFGGLFYQKLFRA